MGDWIEYKKLILHDLKHLREGQEKILILLQKHEEEEAKLILRIESIKLKTNIMWVGIALFISPLISYITNKYFLKGE